MVQWRCASCGAVHDGLVFCLGPTCPDAWAASTDGEREQGILTADQCVLPRKDHGWDYFLRGHLELPVNDADEVFAWTVWASLSEASFRRASELWEMPGRESEPPFFGWLSNELPYGVPTTPLASHVHTRPIGRVPLIELDPNLDHPLVREQREGISLHRVAELNSLAGL